MSEENINPEFINRLIEAIKTKYGFALDTSISSVLLPLARKVHFEKGDIILGIGEKLDRTYFILSGITRSYYLDLDGNDVTKTFNDEYSLCAGESLFTDEASVQGFEALENVEALEFNAQELKKYFIEIPLLRDIYIKSLELTVIYKMRRENGFQLKSATERYLDFCREYPGLEKRVAQSCIASYLGINPVSLSRIRRTIREEN